MYERRSRLPSYQQRELLKMFVVGAIARATAEVVGVHRNTAASFFMRLRKLIASKLPKDSFSDGFNYLPPRAEGDGSRNSKEGGRTRRRISDCSSIEAEGTIFY